MPARVQETVSTALRAASWPPDSLLLRVHLKAIKLRGFKSFVDPVEIRLEPGVAVVVGPNGSGKSNVSDSILWATGSMSPGELRAEKPDDVLFAGSARPPAGRLLRGRPALRQRRRRLARPAATARSRSRGGCTAAARASTSSTRRRCGASTSSSCSPTSGSAAGCAPSSRRAASRPCSTRSRRSGASWSRRRPGSAGSSGAGTAPS